METACIVVAESPADLGAAMQGAMYRNWWMISMNLPREYHEWRSKDIDRAEDAAYAFGYHLVRHCRDEALAEIPPNLTPDARAAFEKVVDIALHNVCDLLEGFWRLDCGSNHTLSLVLGVRVSDQCDNVIETVEISPSKLDLPVGYWKWAQDGEFR